MRTDRSGKTVLLRSWIEAAGLEDRAGWMSAERAERDAQRFWFSVIHALAGAVDVVERVAPAPTFHGRAVVEQPPVAVTRGPGHA